MKNSEMRKSTINSSPSRLFLSSRRSFSQDEPPPKKEKENRLLFFQFFASLMHIFLDQMMVGTSLPDWDGETFVRTLAKTYAVRFKEV